MIQPCINRYNFLKDDTAAYLNNPYIDTKDPNWLKMCFPRDWGEVYTSVMFLLRLQTAGIIPSQVACCAEHLRRKIGQVATCPYDVYNCEMLNPNLA